MSEGKEPSIRALALTAAAAVILFCLGAGAAPRASAAEGPAFSFTDKPGEHLDVLFAGRPVARYMYAYDTSSPEKRTLTCKPFLNLFDAEGKGFITNTASTGKGIQFPHHRGIFIGWQKIGFGDKKYNLWEMGSGVQVHQKFLDQKAGPAEATLASEVAWNLSDGKTLLQEERTQTFRARPAPTLALLDFTSKLKAVAGDLLLDGDPEHGGIQYRAANELDRKETKYCLPKEGVPTGIDPSVDWVTMAVLKDGKQAAITKLPATDLAWAAMSYVLAGKRYAVQEMSHPGNPKGTVWSAYRDYGRFGAFFRGPLKSGETLTVRYRFIVTEGEPPSREQLQRQYEEYAKATP